MFEVWWDILLLPFRNLQLSLSLKELWRSVSIWQS